MRNINEIKAESKSASKRVNSLIKGMQKNTSYGRTENNAVTFKKSSSPLVDFYAQAGAMRKNPEKALELFKLAWSEDRESAVRILFYLRDVRGGQGERDLFRICLQWIGENYKTIFEKIIDYVPEYGRWDDLFFDNEEVMTKISKQLTKDVASEEPSLLAKWLPTMNASSQSTRAKARFMAKGLGLKDKIYRMAVRDVRKTIKTVEEKMSAKQWDKIEYSAVPSQAARIYRKAFYKHDEERYSKFIEKAEKGEVKINAGTLYPYQIFDSVNDSYDNTLEALWKQLPDYTQGKNAIVVADTSGSMHGTPMSVSVSLALYFAERNKGQFKDYFISFSRNPKLHKIQGENLVDRMRSIMLGDICNTNLQGVFNLILDTAVENGTPEDEMPETIYIISDMEFDNATGYGASKPNYEIIERKYMEAGYKKPSIVFWNVDARSGENLPVQSDEQNVALVSGFSPVVFKMAVENKSPYEVMMDTINSDRYNVITIK